MLDQTRRSAWILVIITDPLAVARSHTIELVDIVNFDPISAPRYRTYKPMKLTCFMGHYSTDEERYLLLYRPPPQPTDLFLILFRAFWARRAWIGVSAKERLFILVDEYLRLKSRSDFNLCPVLKMVS